MSNCLFCDDFVGEETGDGGVKGLTIGGKDICLSCLQELKYRLSQVEAKSPIDREKTEDKEIVEEERPKEEENPFSAKSEGEEP